MPYGIKNETKEQTKWIESCVLSVMKANPKYSDDTAIAICKSRLKKNGWKVPKSSDSLEKLNFQRKTFGPRTI